MGERVGAFIMPDGSQRVRVTQGAPTRTWWFGRVRSSGMSARARGLKGRARGCMMTKCVAVCCPARGLLSGTPASMASMWCMRCQHAMDASVDANV